MDYRRVNARTLRAIYYVRRAEDVKSDAAGSIWLTFLDAVTGFNQVVNTQRGREMLAVIARSGQFLPVCLTFGASQRPGGLCVRRGPDVLPGAQCCSPVLPRVVGLRR